jgi:hypothetical protein
VGKDDEDCQERPDCRAGVASDLEERLGEAVLSARGHSRYAGRLWMEDRRAHADQRSGEEQQGEGGGDRQQQQADEREDHPDGKGVGHRLAVGVVSDDWLKEGRCNLEGEGDEADLGEVEMERCFEDGIDRRQQRLHHVVEHVAEADSREHTKHGFFFGCVGGIYCLLRDSLSAHSGFLCDLFLYLDQRLAMERKRWGGYPLCSILEEVHRSG